MARIERRWVAALALLVLATLSTALPVYAQTYSVLYNFGSRSGDPSNPLGRLSSAEQTV